MLLSQKKMNSTRWIKIPISEFLRACQSFTLSPGERAGVRGSVDLIKYFRLKWSSQLFFLLVILALMLSGAIKCPAAQFEKGDFRFDYDEHGVIGLADPHDPFGAQIVPRGQRLGLSVRFRSGDGEWQTLPSGNLQSNTPPASGLVYVSHAPGDLFTTTQTFATDGAALDWNIELESTSNAPVEIGDFSINIPAVGPRGEDPKEIFEHGFLKHQFISGNGSFLRSRTGKHGRAERTGNGSAEGSGEALD